MNLLESLLPSLTDDTDPYNIPWLIFTFSPKKKCFEYSTIIYCSSLHKRKKKFESESFDSAYRVHESN